jgi:ribosomal RNA-processing protein 36
MKKTRAVDAYDEASSGSDSSDDEDDVNDDSSVGEEEQIPPQKSGTNRHDEENDEESSGSKGDDSNSSASEGNDSDSGNESDEDQIDKGANQEEGKNSEHGSDEDLPLHERVQRKEERGLSMHKSRERKSKALKVASKRLAKLKTEKADDDNDNGQPAAKRKKSKHAPLEVSSKRSDFYRRGAPRLNESGLGVDIGAHRYKPLDPRMSNLSGHLDEEQFERNYGFLGEMHNKEMKQLKKQIAARKVTGKKGKVLRHRFKGIAGASLEEDEERLKQMKQEKADLARRKLDRDAKTTVKRKIRDDVEEGKRGVYFLKRKEKRQLELEAKLEVIHKKGGDKAVEKVMAKRRSKAKSRDAGLFASK